LPPDLQQFAKNYARLAVSTLIVWGKEGEIIPLAIGRRLHEALPSSELVMLDAVGHAVQEEKPSLLLPYLLHFLAAESPDKKIEPGF